MSSEGFWAGASVLPDDPTELTAKDYRTALKATVAETKRDDVPSLAAGVAFKIFLSLFPAAIAAAAVFSLVTSPEDILKVRAAIGDLIPNRAAEVVTGPLDNLVEDDSSDAGGLAIGGLLAGVWAASSAAVTLMKALSRAYDVEETRKFLGQRFIALAITLALFVTMVGMVLLLVAGGPIQEALLPPQFGPVGQFLVTAARLAGALALLVALFAFVYWIGPDRERPAFTWLSPGSAVGVVGWLLTSGGFTLYVRMAGDYEATYGALAGVIVLLLWLQLSMMMLLIGGELNNELQRVRTAKAVLADGSGFALAAPLSEAASNSPEPGDGLVLPAVPPYRGDGLPGLEGRGKGAGPGGDGQGPGASSAGAKVGALFAGLRRRRLRRDR